MKYEVLCVVCTIAFTTLTIQEINAIDLKLVPVVTQTQQRNPSAVPQEPNYVLPYRNDQAAREANTAAGIGALLDATNRNGAMLGELLQLEKSRVATPSIQVPSVPVDVKPIETPKESLGERIKDRIEDRKEAVKEKVDALTESPLARALFFVAIAAVVLWIAISQHRKAGTPTHIARAMDYVATATAGVPVLGNITAAADKLTDNVGDKIRELQIKMEAHKQEQAALKQKLDGTAALANTTAQVVTQRTPLS